MSILGTLMQSILKLDLVAPNHNLTFRESDKFSSLFGVVFSIVAIVLTILSISSSLSDFFNGTNPNIINKYNLETTNSTLTSHNFMFYVQFTYYSMETQALILLDSNEIPEPPLYNRRFRNESSIYYDDLNIPMIRCDDYLREHYNDDLDEANKISGSVLERAVQSTYCIDPNAMNFTMKTDNMRQIMFGVTIPGESYTVLTNKYLFVLIHVNYKETILVPDRYKKPYQNIWKTTDKSIVKNQYSYNIAYLRRRKIIVEQSSFLFQKSNSTEIEDYQLLSYNNALQNPIDPELYKKGLLHMDIVFIKDDSFCETTIKYIMLDSIIADFGGTFEVILFICEITFSMFFDFRYKTTLINTFFKYHNIIDDEEVNRLSRLNSNISKLDISKRNSKKVDGIELKNMLQNNLEDNNSKRNIFKLISKKRKNRGRKDNISSKKLNEMSDNIIIYDNNKDNKGNQKEMDQKNNRFSMFNNFKQDLVYGENKIATESNYNSQNNSFINVNSNRVIKTEGNNYSSSNNKYLLEQNKLIPSKYYDNFNNTDKESNNSDSNKNTNINNDNAILNYNSNDPIGLKDNEIVNKISDEDDLSDSNINNLSNTRTLNLDEINYNIQDNKTPDYKVSIEINKLKENIIYNNNDLSDKVNIKAFQDEINKITMMKAQSTPNTSQLKVVNSKYQLNSNVKVISAIQTNKDNNTIREASMINNSILSHDIIKEQESNSHNYKNNDNIKDDKDINVENQVKPSSTLKFYQDINELVKENNTNMHIHDDNKNDNKKHVYEHTHTKIPKQEVVEVDNCKINKEELDRIKELVQKRVSIQLYNIHKKLQSQKTQVERLDHLSSMIVKVYTEDKLDKLKTIKQTTTKQTLTSSNNNSINNIVSKHNFLTNNLSKEIKDFTKKYRKRLYIRYKEVFMAFMKSCCCSKRMNIKDKIITRSIESVEYVTSFENIFKLFFDNVIIKQYLEITSRGYCGENSGTRADNDDNLNINKNATSSVLNKSQSSKYSHFSQLYNMLKMPSLNINSCESIKILNTIVSNYREFDEGECSVLVDYLDVTYDDNKDNMNNNVLNETNQEVDEKITKKKNKRVNENFKLNVWCTPPDESLSLDLKLVDYVNRSLVIDEVEDENENKIFKVNPVIQKKYDRKMKLFKNYLKNFV